MAEAARLYPRLPSVEKIASSPPIVELLEVHGRDSVLTAVRGALEELRARIKRGEGVDDAELEAKVVGRRAVAILERAVRPRVRKVINATGVVVHTNLGRAVLAAGAVTAVAEAAAESLALEYDLERGGRGDRDRLVEDHLLALTGAEAATVVNNNAGAVMLVLNSLAEGREVIVSRGELIEIGGSFRIPEIMAKSGVRMVEVGTTNRTHRDDYERARGPQTAILLKVHTSNYRVVGFTTSVELEELHDVAAHGTECVVAEDLGAGALVDLSRWGLPAEPVARDRLARGADVVTFSGDKLLGGPQCGIIVGRADLVDRMRRNPLKRALRCDKLTLAALEATLRIYRFDAHPEREIPTLQALMRTEEELERVGRQAADLLGRVLGDAYEVSVVASEAQIGSGSQPTTVLASRAVCVRSDSRSADAIAAMFRTAATPVIGRIQDDRFLLDLRTIDRPADLIPDMT